MMVSLELNIQRVWVWSVV